MPIDLAALAEPGHTAVVAVECQNGVIGEQASLPALAAAARTTGMVANVAQLVRGARAVGARVVHCTAERRADGLGANANARLFAATARSPVQLVPGTRAVQVLDEIGVEDSDLVLPRLHGVSPFSGTELDFLLRNMGVTTIVAVGVSVNVAIPNLAFDGVNAGYQVVVPRDAVAGVPLDYVDAVFANTLSVVATLTTTDELLDAWGPAPS
jgi:nicotinamidase-related amidase